MSLATQDTPLYGNEKNSPEGMCTSITTTFGLRHITEAITHERNNSPTVPFPNSFSNPKHRYCSLF